MFGAARALQVFIRVCGVGALLLGLARWAGYLMSLLPLHQAFGMGLVLALAVVAVMALSRKERPRLATLVLLLAAAVPWLGITQTRLMPGPQHWIIALTHLALGGIAMGIGTRLAGMLGQPKG